jgi:CubicO group peptidase (beta-lactamase class C family)
MITNISGILARTTPEQQGIDSAAVLEWVTALEDQIHEMHSFMLLRHGCVIAEGWWSPYGREYRHMMFSISKSFTSTGVGLAINEGRFSLDDTVLSFFPGIMPAPNEFAAEMKVRHLLSMSTGHETDTWTNMMSRHDGDWIKGFFEVPVLHVPGTHFLYNTGASHILAAIVQKTTGMTLMNYLTSRLFVPLGIENPLWDESPQGITLGGIGLWAKTEDIARLGQLYLQKGQWQGTQILPEAWVAEATASHISNGNDPENDWAQGYAYQFWRCRHGAYRGDGLFGQYCVVMPEQDAVLAMTGAVDVFDMQPPLNLVWAMLLPAMRDATRAAPLPENAAAQNRLTEKLSTLRMIPPQGAATSPLAAQVSGRIYQIDGNIAEIETVSLDFTDAGCTITIKTKRGEDTIRCGYGTWERSQTGLFSYPNNRWLVTPTPVATGGAWVSEDRFTTVMRLYETTFFHTVTYHFAGDELMIESRGNVGFEPPPTLIFMGRAV